MVRGATPYGLRGTALAIPDGTLENPAVRLSTERSGLYRVGDGTLGLAIKKFKALAIAAPTTTIFSNGAGSATPLTLTRTTAALDGQETATDIYEAATQIARVAIYRQAAGKHGFKWYGSSGGALHSPPAMVLDGDKNLTVQGNTTVVGGLSALGPLNGSNYIVSRGGFPDATANHGMLGAHTSAAGKNALLTLYTNAGAQGAVLALRGGSGDYDITAALGGLGLYTTTLAPLALGINNTPYITIQATGTTLVRQQLQVAAPTGMAQFKLTSQQGGQHVLFQMGVNNDGQGFQIGITGGPPGFMHGGSVGDVSFVTSHGYMVFAPANFPRFSIEPTLGDIVAAGRSFILRPPTGSSLLALQPQTNGEHNQLIMYDHTAANALLISQQGGSTPFGLGNAVGAASIYNSAAAPLILGTASVPRLTLNGDGSATYRLNSSNSGAGGFLFQRSSDAAPLIRIHDGGLAFLPGAGLAGVVVTRDNVPSQHWHRALIWVAGAGGFSFTAGQPAPNDWVPVSGWATGVFNPDTAQMYLVLAQATCLHTTAANARVMFRVVHVPASLATGNPTGAPISEIWRGGFASGGPAGSWFMASLCALIPNGSPFVSAFYRIEAHCPDPGTVSFTGHGTFTMHQVPR